MRLFISFIFLSASILVGTLLPESLSPEQVWASALAVLALVAMPDGLDT